MRHIFIINPAAGKHDISETIRADIEKICAERNIDPLIFISEYAGYERDMTRKMCTLFSNEPIRFYSIGGSGTLYQIICGITNFETTEVACYASGLTNDLLKCYVGDISAFRSLEKLIDGKTDYLDLIEMGDVKCPNFISFGLGTGYFSDRFLFRVMSAIAPLGSYTLGIISDLLRNKIIHYEIKIDGVEYNNPYALIVCFNGLCMGGSIIPYKSPRPNDGTLNFVLIESMSRLEQFKTLFALKAGKTDKIGNKIRMIKGTKMEVARKDGQLLLFNCDGEGECSTNGSATLRVRPKTLQFIVPREVQILSPEE